jgi:hypothetical protein
MPFIWYSGRDRAFWRFADSYRAGQRGGRRFLLWGLAGILAPREMASIEG